MKLLKRMRRQQHRQSAPANPNATNHPPLLTVNSKVNITAMDKAISITEILERVLSFLPQQSLRQTASLVCKNWLALCRPLYHHELQWTDSPGTSRISSNVIVSTIPELPCLKEQLENLTTLKCRLSWRTPNWAVIIDPVASQSSGTFVVTTVPTMTLQDRARMDLLRAFKDLAAHGKLSLLELFVQSLDDFDLFLRPMLPCLTTLTRLSLSKTTIPLLPVGLVLRHCRRLEDLLVECEVLATKPRMTMVLFTEADQEECLSTLQHPLHRSKGQEHSTRGMNQGRNPGALGIKGNGLPKSVRLRRLHLKDVLLKENTLHAILNSAPSLYELFIQSLVVFPVATGSHPQHPEDPVLPGDRIVTCDRMDFFRDLGQQYPQLTSLHFTNTYHRYTETEIREILKAFPKASKWSLFWRDLPDGILRELNRCVEASSTLPQIVDYMHLNCPSPMIYTNHLTTLEIVPSVDWTPRWGNALHEFLCDSPLLEHLRAGSVAYYVEHMDLNGLLFDIDDYVGWDNGDAADRDANSAGYESQRNYALNLAGVSAPHIHFPSSSQNRPRRVWACRNLRTLHLEFTRRKHLLRHISTRPTFSIHATSSTNTSYESNAGSIKTSVIIHEDSPRLSRIVFGYITRFCPRLQDLLIRSYKLNMTLKGGFTLLTRLHHLKRLSVSQYDCQFHERDILPWVMKRRNPTLAQRLRWRVIVAGWWKLAHSKELKGHPSQRNVDADNQRATSTTDDQQMPAGIEKLGHLSDVVDVLTGIMDVEACTQPELESPLRPSIFCDHDRGYVWPDLESVRVVYGNRVKSSKE
ncbi:hypothetical protein BGZ50_006889, partial [Haplosporangium sp. Z 11]